MTGPTGQEGERKTLERRTKRIERVRNGADRSEALPSAQRRGPAAESKRKDNQRDREEEILLLGELSGADPPDDIEARREPDAPPTIR